MSNEKNTVAIVRIARLTGMLRDDALTFAAHVSAEAGRTSVEDEVEIVKLLDEAYGWPEEDMVLPRKALRDTLVKIIVDHPDDKDTKTARHWLGIMEKTK